MNNIKIHIFHTGEVCVAPGLPFGGDNCNMIQASGILTKKKDRLWLPVSAYLIECEHGKILFDCGWHRDMSPDGVFDKKAQIRSLGSFCLYKVNQGRLGKGQAINEQLLQMGIKDSDLDLVLLSHLDCDHANGLKMVADAKKILVSKDELAFATGKSMVSCTRYQKRWWDGTKLEGFDWNGIIGPARKSYDVYGDGSIVMVNIPGHSDGLCALKITNEDGKYVLLFADGGYAEKSWKEMITSGVAADKVAQKHSLEWIREQSMDEKCVESLANHDADIVPHTITL